MIEQRPKSIIMVGISIAADNVFYNRLVLENPSNNFNVWDVKNGKVNQQRHCVKTVQIRRFFWSVFYHIQSEYGKIRARKISVKQVKVGHMNDAMITLPLDTKLLSTRKPE